MRRPRPPKPRTKSPPMLAKKHIRVRKERPLLQLLSVTQYLTNVKNLLTSRSRIDLQRLCKFLAYNLSMTLTILLTMKFVRTPDVYYLLNILILLF